MRKLTGSPILSDADRRTRPQSESPTAVERLLSAIREVRAARRCEDLQHLSDSELLLRMVEDLSDDPSERLPITIAMAVSFAVGPDIEPAHELLEEFGLSDFEPEELNAVRDSQALREFKQAERDFVREQIDEHFHRMRATAIAAGSIATGRRPKPAKPRVALARKDDRK
jgi:hypothetical protein